MKTTIINYDKDNNSWSWIFDNLKKEVPKVSSEVDKLFSKIKKDKDFSELLDGFYNSKTFKDTDFNDWVDSLDDAKKEALTAGDALEEYKGHLQSVDKASSKFGSTLKSIGGSIASGLANFAIGAAIGFAIDSVIKQLFKYRWFSRSRKCYYVRNRYLTY